MDWLAFGMALYLLVGMGVAEFTRRMNEGALPWTNYVFITLLWAVFLPVSMIKILQGSGAGEGEGEGEDEGDSD